MWGKCYLTVVEEFTLKVSYVTSLEVICNQARRQSCVAGGKGGRKNIWGGTNKFTLIFGKEQKKQKQVFILAIYLFSGHKSRSGEGAQVRSGGGARFLPGGI